MSSPLDNFKLYTYEAAELQSRTNENTPQKEIYKIVREIVARRHSRQGKPAYRILYGSGKLRCVAHTPIEAAKLVLATGLGAVVQSNGSALYCVCRDNTDTLDQVVDYISGVKEGE